MQLTYAELSRPGRDHSQNEDCLGFWQPDSPDRWRSRGAVAALSDGIGSFHQSHVASRIAVTVGVQTFRETSVGSGVVPLLMEAIRTANEAVYAAGLGVQPPVRMGATLAVAVFWRGELFVGNVGDTRVYHVRGPDVRQLSVDHSLAGIQRQFGLLTDEQARQSADRRTLTRCIGLEPEITPDFATAMLSPGDRVVLCTDGLHQVVTDRELGEIVTHAAPAEACRRLVALAEHRGSTDDISAQVIEVNALGNPPLGATASQILYLPREADPLDLQPGQTLHDRFLLTEVIARSGMAMIMRALDLTTHVTVVVKLPFAQFRHRLRHEAEVLHHLSHPYILQYVAVHESEKQSYLVTEYLRGYTLAQLLRNICPLPVGEAVKIAGRVAEALEHVHALGWTHRDVKPANVMLCHDDSLRLMDFGLAGRLETRASVWRRFQPAAGTPDYIAPEQVQGKPVDGRADQFALAVMLYEMLSGEMPYAGKTPQEVMQARLREIPVLLGVRNPKVPAHIEKAVARALARKPADRFASVTDFRRALLAGG